jgi:hypothetical protein
LAIGRGLRPIEDQDLSDVLHCLRAQAVADLRQRRVARFAFHGANAHLDEFVRRQRAVDFRHDCIGKAFLADVNDRIERVRAAFKGFAFRRRQL